MFWEEQTSEGKRGRMLGRFSFPGQQGATLWASERVVEGDRPGRDIHRVTYAYYLLVDDREVWARERDPGHDPPEHGHGLSHERVPADRVSFKEAVDQAWQALEDYRRQ